MKPLEATEKKRPRFTGLGLCLARGVAFGQAQACSARPVSWRGAGSPRANARSDHIRRLLRCVRHRSRWALRRPSGRYGPPSGREGGRRRVLRRSAPCGLRLLIAKAAICLGRAGGIMLLLLVVLALQR